MTWDEVVARQRAVASIIDALEPGEADHERVAEDINDTHMLLREHQGPSPAEWSEAYQIVRRAHLRWARRCQSWQVERQIEHQRRDVSAALERVSRVTP